MKFSKLMAGRSLLAISCMLGAYCANANELQSTEPKLLFGTSFEGGSLKDWNISGNAPVLAKEQVRAGSYAIKSHLHRQESDASYRTELRLPGSQDIGKEYWYGFSIYLVGPYASDSIADTLAQWHAIPDSGEDHQNPPLSLSVLEGEWRLTSRWNLSQPTVKELHKAVNLNIGRYDANKWTDWVFHIKWSTGNDGLLEVWKNGERVIARTGPNCYVDEKGPYFKMGIYKPGWKSASSEGNVVERLLYHDEFRMAGTGASYADVAPGKKGAISPNPPVAFRVEP